MLPNHSKDKDNSRSNKNKTCNGRVKGKKSETKAEEDGGDARDTVGSPLKWG